MADKVDIKEVLESLRKSDSAKGRTYTGTGVEPQWLATETSEYCKSQAWENVLTKLPDRKIWLVVSDNVASLFEGSSEKFVVTVADLSPVMLKTGLALAGAAALTGVGIVALPIAGIGVWRASARKAKVSALVKFVDERIKGRGKQPAVTSDEATQLKKPATASVAERLKALAGLKEQGLVSAEEYEAKRQELIKQL
jgi:hypothetical protein